MRFEHETEIVTRMQKKGVKKEKQHLHILVRIYETLQQIEYESTTKRSVKYSNYLPSSQHETLPINQIQIGHHNFGVKIRYIIHHQIFICN